MDETDDATWLAAVQREIALNVVALTEFRRKMSAGDFSALTSPKWPYPMTPRRLPRTIWMYWAQGWNEAPELVRKCRSTWQLQNPDWTVISLDDDLIPQYADLFSIIEDRSIGVAHRSDILRLQLLHRHGGVWADATTVCLRPLSDWLPLLMQSGFFAFAAPGPDRLLSNWFLASEPSGEIIDRWFTLARRYWSEVTQADHYFWVHYLFGFGCRTDPVFKAGWAMTPKLSAHGALQARSLGFGPAHAKDVFDSLSEGNVPVFKLDWRQHCRPDVSDFSPMAELLRALIYTGQG